MGRSLEIITKGYELRKKDKEFSCLYEQYPIFVEEKIREQIMRHSVICTLLGKFQWIGEEDATSDYVEERLPFTLVALERKSAGLKSPENIQKNKEIIKKFVALYVRLKKELQWVWLEHLY